MKTVTKRTRKVLRKLADVAYERELTARLEGLAEKFDGWRAGTLDPWDLENLIHRFHDGDARDLWKKYQGLNPEELVGAAVVDGVLQLSEVPEGEAREFVEDRAESIRQFREMYRDQLTEDDGEE